MLVGAGALDSPLEVTRFEFTIKSCRCTKTSEGVGLSHFCELTNRNFAKPLQFLLIDYSSAKSLRSLRIYIALRDRKAVQI